MKIKLALTVFFLSLFSFLLAAQIYTVNVNAQQTNPISSPIISPITSGIVSYWKMDEGSGSGTLTADSAGKYTGTLVGNPAWVAGKFGQAVKFNGNSYIKASPPRSGRDQITMAGWINFDTPSNLNNKDSYHDLFGWSWEFRLYYRTYTQEPGAGYFLWLQGTTKGGSRTHNIDFTYLLPKKLTGWHHLSATYDGTNAKIYLDGIAVKSQQVQGGGAIKNTGSNGKYERAFHIGGDTESGQYFDGAIDDVKLYYRSLSDSEINQLANPEPVSKRVFVTSTRYNGNLGGLSGADAKCQDRANAANLGSTWKAWLSDSVTSAASRLLHSNTPYKLLDGRVIANNWTDLTDGTLQNPIEITELGTRLTGPASCSWCGFGFPWTNTNQDGSLTYTNGTKICNNFASSSATGDTTSFRQGQFASTNAQWSRYPVTADCNTANELYCFEQ